MSPDIQRRVFDPYFTTKRETGTGLGVPQVCAFMKLVGGSVTVESAVGVGTEFDLLFPVHSAAPLADQKLCRRSIRWASESVRGILGHHHRS
jgi:signal transduction histidine kinase